MAAKSQLQSGSTVRPQPSNIPVDNTTQRLHVIEENIGRVIKGKPEIIRQLVTTLVAGGHVLIEDVPGVGKTTMAVALATSIGGNQQRIQFTSDLLPSDVIGVLMFNQQEQRFDFKKGPLFAHVVLADEINRTTPKTQSCMLEAMQDGAVSIDGKIFPLPDPFMVIATQNPIEHHGTYPLPESQLDRFMMRLHVGYPELDDELQILRNPMADEPVTAIEPVCQSHDILEFRSIAKRVRVDDSVNRYMLAIAQATRNHSDIDLGVSTRGVLLFHRACQARALLEGRDYVTPDDVKRLAQPVLAHRILVRHSFQGGITESESHQSASMLLDDILESIEVPR